MINDTEVKTKVSPFAVRENEVKVFDGLTLVGVKKAACVKRNPLTGADVQVPEKIAPKAKFGKALKDAINA